MWKQQQALSGAGVDVRLMDCTLLVAGLCPCSFCGVLSWYAKPPGHIFGGSGGGSLQPQPSPSQCHASHLRHVLLLSTAKHSLRSGPFCVPLDDGRMSSLFVWCTPFAVATRDPIHHTCHLAMQKLWRWFWHLPLILGTYCLSYVKDYRHVDFGDFIQKHCERPILTWPVAKQTPR